MIDLNQYYMKSFTKQHENTIGGKDNMKNIPKDNFEFTPSDEELGVAITSEHDNDNDEEESTDSSSVRTSPKFSKAFLEYMESTFDTRKMLVYAMSLDELKGVQSVLDHMRYLYKHNFRLD